jgi:hypothetical protein
VCLAALLRRCTDPHYSSVYSHSRAVVVMSALGSATALVGAALAEPLPEARGAVPTQWILQTLWGVCRDYRLDGIPSATNGLTIQRFARSRCKGAKPRGTRTRPHTAPDALDSTRCARFSHYENSTASRCPEHCSSRLDVVDVAIDELYHRIAWPRPLGHDQVVGQTINQSNNPNCLEPGIELLR